MAHSNIHPYPLPFPNEVQRTQVASYSSLANALGTNPGNANRQRRTPRTKRDAVTNTQGIYLNGPPISNPSYPYPARNILNPGTYPARTPSSMPNRSPSNASVVWGENSDQKDLPRFLPRHDRLPQPQCVEPDKSHGCQAGIEFPAIRFLRRGDQRPYSLQDLLTIDTMPDLVGGDSPILVHNPGRWIKVKLIV